MNNHEFNNMHCPFQQDPLHFATREEAEAYVEEHLAKSGEQHS